MSFSGSVSQPSHEGGLLVSFEGRAPGLYTGIRIVGGKFLGRVDSVIGSVNGAFIHIKPLAEGVVAENALGSPVEIAPRDRRPRDDRKRNNRGRDNNRGGNDRRSFDRDIHMKPGDWRCPKCKNHNYANKQFCNRSTCNEKKPSGSNNSYQGRGNNRGRDNNRGRHNTDDSNIKPGDWICPKCKNHNYASKNFCNRSSCDMRKPGGPTSSKGSRNTPARARRPDRKSTEKRGNSNSSRRQTSRQSSSGSGKRRRDNNRSGKKFNSRR